MSRQNLIAAEFPALIAAQVQAAGMKHYRQWTAWMKQAFTYTLAVRMANALGYAKPCEEWYIDMRVVGQRIMKEMHATERVNYDFHHQSQIDFDGGESPSLDHQDGRARTASYR